ncbi:MAG: hypothetical protein JSW10_00090 [Pseudomonadota bacterium]|nr:MAG: hypothetical protein JSW10_00090 [Pseudomonadota bacterium]
MMSSTTARLADNISSGILNQNDPETVREGAPAYLLLIDGLIDGEPGNTSLLMTGARLYGSYATVFVDDRARAELMIEKAWRYGQHAFCTTRADACGVQRQTYPQYVEYLGQLGKQDLPALYTMAVAWAGWIQLHSEDMAAIAEIPKVRATFERVVALDEGYAGGEAHLYLGVLSILMPPALGGKPEAARGYFERAIELSEGRDLMAKVLYAERYGRMMFDRELHDRLLREVLEADPEQPGLTLKNVLAQQQARELLDGSAAYF